MKAEKIQAILMTSFVALYLCVLRQVFINYNTLFFLLKLDRTLYFQTYDG